MSGVTAPIRTADPPQSPPRRPAVSSTAVLAGLLVLVLLAQPLLARRFTSPAVQTWATVFVAVCVQALPFLVLGVVISGAIAAFVPAAFFVRALPKNRYAAVPVAGAAGALLPGCECASVPVAGGLMARGVAPSAALAFLLSSPAINPVVVVATAVAFPGRPEMVGARFVASLAAAVLVGWIWARVGRPEWIRRPRRPDTAGMSQVEVFRTTTAHDFLQAGGFLVLGGLTAATLNVLVPQKILNTVAHHQWLEIGALSLLAVLLCVCSEADAFVAASLAQFSLTARLAFLVVGPMVDVKLISLQGGTFGWRFAARFAPLTFVVAVACAVLVGKWLL
jgi:uncharacterized membrane protein YraQ (UPF0718 family)